MHIVTVNIPVPYMLSSAERQAWIDSTLKQKNLYLEDVAAEVIDTVYDVPYDSVKMKLQLTTEQHEKWLKALEPAEQSISIGVKKDD